MSIEQEFYLDTAVSILQLMISRLYLSHTNEMEIWWDSANAKRQKKVPPRGLRWSLRNLLMDRNPADDKDIHVDSITVSNKKAFHSNANRLLAAK